MLLLTLRTDKPDAELGLYDGATRLNSLTWLADRRLVETLHAQIRELLTGQNQTWSDLGGLVVYEGPGSFTGLRIGVSVANALAYANQLPIVATTGERWLEEGLQQLAAGSNEQLVLPAYGSEAHITLPKK